MKKLSLLFSLLCTSVVMFAQSAGSIDSSFAGTGKNTYYDLRYNFSKKVVVAPNGKVVTVGYAQEQMAPPQNPFFSISDANGNNLNNILYGFQNQQCNLYDAAIQDDTLVVVLGSQGDNSGWMFEIARYNLNGGLDATFQSPYSMASGMYFNGRKLFIQPDGKILIGSQNRDLRRLNRNGSIDSTFAANGYLSLVNNFTIVHDVTVSSSGYIYVSGRNNSSVTVVKIAPNGTIVSSFNNNQGSFNEDLTNVFQDSPTNSRIIANGTGVLVIARGAENFPSPESRLYMMMLDSTGAYSSTFGGGTYVMHDFITNAGENWTDAHIDGNGKVWVFGNIGEYAAIARFTAAGALDMSYSGDGYSTLAVEPTAQSSEINSAVVLSNNKAIIGGAFYLGGTSVAYTARVLLQDMVLGIINPSLNFSEALVYPNPLRSNTLNLEYELSNAAQVRIAVWSVDGRLVTELSNNNEMEGKQIKALNLPENLTNGLYLLNIQADNTQRTIQFSVQR